jgi:hypothetical protein
LLQELRPPESEKDTASVRMSALSTKKRIDASFCDVVVTSNAKDISVSFVFKPDIVDVTRLSLDMIDLDVEPHCATIVLDTAAFAPGAADVSQAVAKFSAAGDPDSATAKYHRASATLVVNIRTC